METREEVGEGLEVGVEAPEAACWPDGGFEVGGAAVGDLLAGGCLNIIVVQVMYTSVLSPADTGDDLLTGGCPNVDIV